MKYEELILLLPCHSLEDFPLYHTGAEAEGLLSAWTALWHPAFLASANTLPSWFRADSPPDRLGGRLIVIPQVSESLLAAGWAARAKNEGAFVIRKQPQREAILKAALAELDGGDAGIDPQLVGDFLALGFCHLQVELLIRQMRHYSNLDETHLRTQALAAAQAAVAKDAATARGHLQQCFDVLCESRERCYGATAYLIDITLTAGATLGASLRRELQPAAGDPFYRPTPVNLALAGDVLSQMAREEPASLELVKQAVADGRAEIIGGEAAEREFPLLPPESIRHGLLKGRELYRQHLGASPKVYARRRFGLCPALPQILARSGFHGAFHFTLDDGQFPKPDQAKTRWEGLDPSTIDAFARVPLDANDPAAFLHFAEKMGETMDLDHVAAVAFAHWPGQNAVFYEDLKRISRYAPVLGKLVSATEFFRESEAPGRTARFSPDDYRAPYLKQSIIRRRPDVASRYAQHLQRRLTWDSAQMLAALGALLTSKPPTDEVRGKLGAALSELEASASPLDEPAPADLDGRLADLLAAEARGVAACLPQGQAADGCLVFNPQSFARRVAVELPQLSSPPDVAGPVLAAQTLAAAGGKPGVTAAVLELPACGYAFVAAGPAAKSKAFKPLVEEKELLIRNDFCEVTLDKETGGIRSIRDYQARANRLSQQLAFRLPSPKPKPGAVWHDPDLDAIYTEMRADSLEFTSTGPALGEAVSRGKLIDPDGKRLAGFEQRIRVWRALKTIELTITLTCDEQPKADPWNSYYAARFAWGDETADVFRSAGWQSAASEAKRLEAPLFLEVRTQNTRTSLFTAGLPWHRRMGLRKLDSLLVSRGETAATFRLGIGVEVDHPALEALSFLAPTPTAAAPQPKATPTCWFFHVDAKHVTATGWDTIVEDGRIVGYRVRLLETEGKRGPVRLRSFRTPARARQVDFLGEPLADLQIDGDAVKIDLSACEWAEVEVRW